MKGNWGIGIAITLLLAVIVFTLSLLGAVIRWTADDPILTGRIIERIISIITTIFIIYPITLSMAMLFLNFVRDREQLSVEGLFSGFSAQYYGKAIGLYLLTYIFTYLWTLLLIVPGIIKGLSYSLAPYILADNPELSANQAINESMKMMKGHKMDLFLMMLGAIGLSIASIVLLCLPLLWIIPYYQTVMAAFYENVKQNYSQEAC